MIAFLAMGRIFSVPRSQLLSGARKPQGAVSVTV
jgi:hypothetical protein